jgi:hypothetical protein
MGVPLDEGARRSLSFPAARHQRGSRSTGDHGMLNPNFRVNGHIYVLQVVERYYLLRFGDPNYDPNADDYNLATIGRLPRYDSASVVERGTSRGSPPAFAVAWAQYGVQLQKIT